jgi:hypothetical protein
MNGGSSWLRGQSRLPLKNAITPAKAPPAFPNSEHVMKISGVDIRPGNIIEYEGGIWRA